MTTPSGVEERELYENIVEIPHYQSYFGQLLDREDEELIVQESFEKFKSLYRPIIDSHFKDAFEITSDGKFIIDPSNEVQRKHLFRNLNDNVF